MIIVEDAKPQLIPQHHAAAQLSSNFGPGHPQSPPGATSYTLSYHTAPLLPPSPPPSYPRYPSHAPPLPSVQCRQSPVKRFWKAFAVALIIYLAILSLTHTIIRMASGGIHWDDDSAGVPRVEDGRILQSIGSLDWSSYHARPRWAPSFSESAETSFSLPIDSQELYLISRGSYQNGRVQVKQSTEQGDGDVKVDVRVAYHNDRALARATVCRLHKSGNREGVGIYTPTPAWRNVRDRLYFEVVITFPAAKSESSPLRIKEFTTHTSNFAHEIGDLWQSILFEDIELNTSNSPIQVNSITLTRGSLTSSNSPITGHFNTADSLSLRTSNAHIQTTASMLSIGGNVTQLEMRTSNRSVPEHTQSVLNHLTLATHSPITSSVSLTTESGSGGNFVVKAYSSNGAIKLQYDEAPLRARLVSDVRTSNSPASVAMHPAFEGRYEVSTSNSRPIVRDTHPTDPSGAGRRRIVNRTTSRNTISGMAYWGNEGARRGGESASTVHTSNARVSLDI
ncbi:hypothetical protein J3R83DRAFT_203 [Lanmaoa asiatica]|nr:hypothetical protein J3R83DRAFT_203 [Lanmaoa asiatica]